MEICTHTTFIINSNQTPHKTHSIVGIRTKNVLFMTVSDWIYAFQKDIIYQITEP